MLTFEDEEDLLDDIREGVAVALHETSFGGEVDDIKLNKLAFFPIRNFNLHITYGWFKYGPAPYPVDGATRGKVTYIEPKALEEIPAAEVPRIPTIDNDYLSPEEYAYYFLHDIPSEFERIVTTETKEYLEQFYQDYAPEEYKQLYIESARLQQDLDTIRDSDDWFEESERYLDSVEEGLNNVYREILKIPSLSEAVGSFQRYNRLLKDILVAANSQSDLAPEQQRFLRKVIDFFYGSTWEHVALLISQDTVTGDNKKILKKSIEDDLQVIRENYDEDIEGLRERAVKFGLLPEAVEEREHLVEESQELPRQEDETEVVDAWTSLAAEVMMDDERQ